MANLQGYSYNRVLGNSPDWRHTISYTQTGRNGTSATYKVVIGLQLTEGNFGYGSYVRARVTVNGNTSSWANFTSNNYWAINSHKTVTINITAPAGSGGGTLPAKVEWNCSSYATSPNYSVSGEFSVSTWNTPPYFDSGQRWLNVKSLPDRTLLNGFYSETVSSLLLEWGSASDKEGGALTYILQQQINDGGWTTIYNGPNTSNMFEIGTGNEGETRLFRVTVKDNNGVQASDWIQSNKIKKNTLTAGSITGTSGSITSSTSSFNVNFSGGSNADGSQVKYSIYSDTVTIRNQRQVTGTYETIYIYKGGGIPSGPYIDYDDLKRAFENSSFKGNIHIGLATHNNYGTVKYNSYSEWVDLRSDPNAPSYVNITGGSAYKNVNGYMYYIPNGTDTITFEWGGGGDPLSNNWKYTLYQIVDGNPTFIAEVSKDTYSYSITPPRRNGQHTLAFSVHVVTDYGTDSARQSNSIDLHYYNPPVFMLNNLTRTANVANVDFTIKTDTSIPRVSISGDWRCESSTGQSNSGYISDTQSNQNISVSLFNESSHNLKFSYQDNTGLSGTLYYTTTIPALNSLMFLNKYGLGIGGNRADANYPFSVNGVGLAKSFTAEGVKGEDTGGSKSFWWLHVADFKIETQNKEAQAVVNILSNSTDSATSITGELVISVNQKNPMGQSATVSMVSNYLTGLSSENIRLIAVTNSYYLTEHQLWIQLPYSYTTLNASIAMKTGDVVLLKEPKLMSSPPGGSYINCKSGGGGNSIIGYKGSDESNDYYGMRGPDNSPTNYLRVPSLGLLPFNTSGNSSLGTRYWKFNTLWINKINDYTVETGPYKNRSAIPTIDNAGVMGVGTRIDFYSSESGSSAGNRLELTYSNDIKAWGGFQTNLLKIGDGSTGDISYYSGQMTTQNVDTFVTDNILTRKKVRFEHRIESVLSSASDLYAEGRSNNYGWHFANVDGQYADLYAKRYNQQSDIRTKTEIERPLFLDQDEDRQTILEKITTIKPKVYYYNSDSQKTPIYGFFAQELEKEFPLTVNTLKYTDEEIEKDDSILPKDKDGNVIRDLKTIDPVAITAVLWEGLKEAKEEIEVLKEEIRKLKEK